MFSFVVIHFWWLAIKNETTAQLAQPNCVGQICWNNEHVIVILFIVHGHLSAQTDDFIFCLINCAEVFGTLNVAMVRERRQKKVERRNSSEKSK